MPTTHPDSVGHGPTQHPSLQGSHWEEGTSFQAIFKCVKVELSSRSPPGTEFDSPSHSQK